MARSLARARPPSPLGRLVAPILPFLPGLLSPALAVEGRTGCQCVELPLEVADVGFHRPGLAAAEPEHEAPDGAQDDGDPEESERVHDVGTSSTGWAQFDQSSPPAQVSRFQICLLYTSPSPRD